MPECSAVFASAAKQSTWAYKLSAYGSPRRVAPRDDGLMQTFLSTDSSLNINIPRPQRIGFDELAARFHFVAHQHGEHAICFDGVVDLHFE